MKEKTDNNLSFGSEDEHTDTASSTPNEIGFRKPKICPPTILRKIQANEKPETIIIDDSDDENHPATITLGINCKYIFF